MRLSFLTALLLAAAATAAPALAQNNLSSADQHFLRHAMLGGRAEVAFAQDVLRKTQNPEADRFARRMIHDHSQNDEQLAALDRKLGVSPAQGIDPEAREAMQRLNHLSGSEFARRYLSYETTDHQKDIADFRDELNRTSNPQIRAYVQQTLPVLREHYQLAQTLQNQAR